MEVLAALIVTSSVPAIVHVRFSYNVIYVHTSTYSTIASLCSYYAVLSSVLIVMNKEHAPLFRVHNSLPAYTYAHVRFSAETVV